MAKSLGLDPRSLLDLITSLLFVLYFQLCVPRSSHFSLFLLLVLAKEVGIDLAIDKCLTYGGSE